MHRVARFSSSRSACSCCWSWRAPSTRYAGEGYAQPVEPRQPGLSVYADLTWPPGADLPATTPLGARIFAQRCAVCHGLDGRGNGPAAPSMIAWPRDFTLDQFKYKSTLAGQPPIDEDLVRVESKSLQASDMPYFSSRDCSHPDLGRQSAVVAHRDPLTDTPGPLHYNRLTQRWGQRNLELSKRRQPCRTGVRY